MSQEGSVSELFDLAIMAERAAESFYRGLAAKFAHHQIVVDFWTRYAAEEVTHAQWLERVWDGLSADQLSAPADPHVLENARHLRQLSVERTLDSIHTLDDAYRVAIQLENSETNVLFEFLLTNFSLDQRVYFFLRTDLQDHITRLQTGFPAEFGTKAQRLATRALE